MDSHFIMNAVQLMISV